MKYNMKEIMTRAWEIFKKEFNKSFGICLKKAWNEIKTKAKNPVEIVKSVVGDNATVSLWENYGKSRIYVTKYFKKGGFNKFWIDLQTGKSYGEYASLRHACTEALGF